MWLFCTRLTLNWLNFVMGGVHLDWWDFSNDISFTSLQSFDSQTVYILQRLGKKRLPPFSSASCYIRMSWSWGTTVLPSFSRNSTSLYCFFSINLKIYIIYSYTFIYCNAILQSCILPVWKVVWKTPEGNQTTCDHMGSAELEILCLSCTPWHSHFQIKWNPSLLFPLSPSGITCFISQDIVLDCWVEFSRGWEYSVSDRGGSFIGEDSLWAPARIMHL